METKAAVRNPEELLTPREVAGIMRCSADYIWKLCREGRLKHIRKGRSILIRRRDITAYIDSQIIGGRDD